MQRFEYNGEKYLFNGKRWLTSSYTAVPTSLVNALNKLLLSEEDFDSQDVATLIEKGAKYKDGENFQLAIKCFEKALEKADVDELKNLLPRLMSCYRKVGRTTDTINTGTHYLDVYGGGIVNPAFFTSLGAAYADIEDYETARMYANKARGLSGAEASGELISLYARLKKFDGGVEI